MTTAPKSAKRHAQIQRATLAFVTENPGRCTRAIVRGLAGRIREHYMFEIGDTLKALQNAGPIERRGDGWYPKERAE